MATRGSSGGGLSEANLLTAAVAAGSTLVALAALYYTTRGSSETDRAPTTATGADRKHALSGGSTHHHAADGAAAGSRGKRGGSGSTSRTDTPTGEREASAMRSVTPTMSYRLAVDSGSSTPQQQHHQQRPGSFTRQVSPTVSLRGSRSGGGGRLPTPPRPGSGGGATAASATNSGGLFATASSGSDDTESSERFYARLPSQLEWADPVLGLYLQYRTEQLVMVAEERLAPAVTLRFDPRRQLSHEAPHVRDFVVLVEQVAPLPDDRGGLGDPCKNGFNPAAYFSTSRPTTTFATPPRRGGGGDATGKPSSLGALDIQSAMVVASPGTRGRSASFGDLTKASSSDQPALSREGHVLNCVQQIKTIPELSVTHGCPECKYGPLSVSVRPHKQRAMEFLEPADVCDTVTYSVIAWTVRQPAENDGPRKSRSSHEAAGARPPRHGVIFITDHPRVPGLFVTVRMSLDSAPVGGRKHNEIASSMKNLLAYIAFAASVPTPSYMLLSEPRYGTGVRLPLCFGRHSLQATAGANSGSATAHGGAAAAAPHQHHHHQPELVTLSESDSDGEVDFARIWNRVSRGAAGRSRGSVTTAGPGSVLRGGSRAGASDAGRGVRNTSITSSHASTRHPPRRGAAAAGGGVRPRLGASGGAGGSQRSTATSSSHAVLSTSNRSHSVSGRGPVRYALLCSEDCAFYAVYEPYVAGGADALGEVTWHCVDRMSSHLDLHPRLISVLDDGAEANQEWRERNAHGDLVGQVIKIRRRHLHISKLGDGSWWSATVRSHLGALGVHAENITDVNNGPRRAQLPTTGRGNTVNPTEQIVVGSAGALNGVQTMRRPTPGTSPAESPASPHPTAQAGQQQQTGEACRFAVYCTGIPSASDPSVASYISFSLIAKTSVGKTPFGRAYRLGLDTLTLGNHRGQGPTLHYVGLRHGVRLRVPKEWHVVEPTLADPALVLFRVAGPTWVPPFLADEASIERAAAAAVAASSSAEGAYTTTASNSGTPPAGSTTDPQFPPLAATAEDAVGNRTRSPPQAPHRRTLSGVDGWELLPPAGDAHPTTTGRHHGLGIPAFQQNPTRLPTSSPDGDARAHGDEAEGAAGGDDAHQSNELQDIHATPDWWQALLPVISLRTAAAPCKLDLTELYAAGPEDAVLHREPTYFELWQLYLVDLVKSATLDAICPASSRDAPSRWLPPPLPEDVTVEVEPLKLHGMRGILMKVVNPVIVETCREDSHHHHRHHHSHHHHNPNHHQQSRPPPAGRDGGALPGQSPLSTSTTQGTHGSPPQASTNTTVAPVCPSPSGSSASSGRFNSCVGTLGVNSVVDAGDPAVAMPPLGNTEPTLQHNPHQAVSDVRKLSPQSAPAEPPHHARQQQQPPGPPVLRLHFSSMHGGSNGGGRGYNPLAPPQLLSLADTISGLGAALAAHLQAWRWAVDSGQVAQLKLPTAGKSTNFNGSVSSSAPQTPLHQPVAPGRAARQPASQWHTSREVRYVAAVLPPMWHREVHQQGIGGGAGGASSAAARPRGDPDEEDNSNPGTDRTTHLWQTQAVPVALGDATRAALLKALRTVELVAPS